MTKLVFLDIDGVLDTYKSRYQLDPELMAHLGTLLDKTGASIGMKSTRTRNFKAGILTDDPALVEAAVNQFDSVWAGFRCKDCARKKFCGDPIIKGY